MRTRWRFALLLAVILVTALAIFRYAPAALAANLVSADLWHRTAKGERVLASSQVDRLASLLQEGSPTGLRVLARLQAADRDLAESESIYRALLEQRHGDALAAFELANLLAAQGRETEAIPFWRQAGAGPYWSARGAELGGCSSYLGVGLHYLDRAVQIDPADGLSQYRLGKRLAQCKQWEESVDALSVPIEANYPDRLLLFDAYMERGIANYQAGFGLEATRTDMEYAMQLQPRNPWPWLRLCSFYSQEGLYTEALAAGDQAVALSPSLAFAYYYRGQAWRASGDLEQATADFEWALSLDPELQAAKHVLEQINQRR